MKTIVIFQGSGPLGAYGCGAWLEVAAWLRAQNHRLIAVGGASIGALNALSIATHHTAADRGAGFLEHLWRDEIATISFPFFGLPFGDDVPAQRIRAWNGVMTGILLGNRSLFTPSYASWNPLGGLQRPSCPFFSQDRTLRLLRSLLGNGYGSTGSERPALGIAAAEVMTGRLRVFSSDRAPLDATELSAGLAIPLAFSPVWLEGNWYWGGEVTGQSMWAPFLQSLVESGRIARDEELQQVTVEPLSQIAPSEPRARAEIADRAMRLTPFGERQPNPAQPRTAAGNWIRIARTAQPFDKLSGQFDYSPERIDTLIAQGREDASAALAAHETAMRTNVAASAGSAPPKEPARLGSPALHRQGEPERTGAERYALADGASQDARIIGLVEPRRHTG